MLDLSDIFSGDLAELGHGIVWTGLVLAHQLVVDAARRARHKPETGDKVSNQGCGSGSERIRNFFSFWIRIQESLCQKLFIFEQNLTNSKLKMLNFF